MSLGMSGVVGYSLKGVDVEVTNAFKADSLKSIKSSRITQGEKEYLDASEEERRDVVSRWHEQEQLQKAKSKQKGKKRAEAIDSDRNFSGRAEVRLSFVGRQKLFKAAFDQYRGLISNCTDNGLHALTRQSVRILNGKS